MPAVHEIGPDIFRISVYVKEFNLQFNHFLVRDDQPLLFHSGLKGMFPAVREAVATVVEPSTIRWVGFSHFESDECGALNRLAGNGGGGGAGMQPGWSAGERERFCGPARAGPRRRGSAGDREPPLPALPNATPAPWLGRRRAVRRDDRDAVLLGPVSSGGGTRAAHAVRRCGPEPGSNQELSGRRSGGLCALHTQH